MPDKCQVVRSQTCASKAVLEDQQEAWHVPPPCPANANAPPMPESHNAVLVRWICNYCLALHGPSPGRQSSHRPGRTEKTLGVLERTADECCPSETNSRSEVHCYSCYWSHCKLWFEAFTAVCLRHPESSPPRVCTLLSRRQSSQRVPPEPSATAAASSSP